MRRRRKSQGTVDSSELGSNSSRLLGKLRCVLLSRVEHSAEHGVYYQGNFLQPAMGRQSWASPAQLQFLKSWIPDFLAHQSAHTVGEFWPIYYRAFLTKFPVRISDLGEREINAVGDATDAIEARERKIRTVSISHSFPIFLC